MPFGPTLFVPLSGRWPARFTRSGAFSMLIMAGGAYVLRKWMASMVSEPLETGLFGE